MDMTKIQSQAYVCPPTHCDVCKHHRQKSTALHAEFYDAATRFGPWANMCFDCFEQYGVGLGTGRGQHYVKQADGKFYKV